MQTKIDTIAIRNKLEQKYELGKFWDVYVISRLLLKCFESEQTFRECAQKLKEKITTDSLERID